MRWLLLLAVAVGASGCFPDYSVEESSGSGGTHGMRRILAKDQQLDSSIASPGQSPIPYSATFDYDFEMDVHEVTVGRFRDWVDASYELPCDDCSLDPGGPYDSYMTWHSEWDTIATTSAFTKSTNCVAVVEADYGESLTWELDDDYPMTCVSWPQAAAFCAYDGKRLPTEAEWLFAAGAGKRKYPWGDENWEGCNQATINYDPATDYPGECSFPVDVGTGSGATPEGIRDLAGSVFEWVWDKTWMNASDWPNEYLNYSGPDVEASVGQGHLRNGGAYWDKPEAERLKNDVFEQDFVDTDVFWDQGFRCVRSLP